MLVEGDCKVTPLMDRLLLVTMYFTNIISHLSQSYDALLGAHTATLDHDEVIVDLSIVREASHGSDRLFGQVILS